MEVIRLDSVDTNSTVELSSKSSMETLDGGLHSIHWVINHAFFNFDARQPSNAVRHSLEQIFEFSPDTARLLSSCTDDRRPVSSQARPCAGLVISHVPRATRIMMRDCPKFMLDAAERINHAGVCYQEGISNEVERRLKAVSLANEGNALSYETAVGEELEIRDPRRDIASALMFWEDVEQLASSMVKLCSHALRENISTKRTNAHSTEYEG